MPSQIQEQPLRAHFLEHAGICFWKDEVSILFVELKDILDLI